MGRKKKIISGDKALKVPRVDSDPRSARAKDDDEPRVRGDQRTLHSIRQQKKKIDDNMSRLF